MMTSSPRNSRRSSFRVSKKRSFLNADWFLPRFGCFCFSLQSCVSVFAWCFTTASFACIILSIIFSVRAYGLNEDTLRNLDDIDSKKRELWVLTFSLLTYGLVSLPLGLLLFYGALQGRRILLVPWLCVAGITFCTVTAVLVLKRSVLNLKLKLAILVALGVLAFAWVHVFSLFYQLRPRRYSVRFSLPIHLEAVDCKVPETTRLNTWPTCAQVLTTGSPVLGAGTGTPTDRRHRNPKGRVSGNKI